MYDLAGENELDLEALRARLWRMNDDALNRFGQAARYTLAQGRDQSVPKDAIHLTGLGDRASDVGTFVGIQEPCDLLNLSI